MIQLAEGTDHQAWADKAAIALALVNARLGNVAVAKAAADRLQTALSQQLQTERSGRLAYFIQLLGQAYSCLNELDTAQSLYQTAMAFATVGHYLQIKAKTLTGFGEIARKQGRFTQSIDYHRQAIATLEQVGARCDLAEAHFQLALTLEERDQRERGPVAEACWEGNPSRTHAEIAMGLFTDIDAPRQVEKVRKFWPIAAQAARP
ncbi:MAG: tetratricopeptide repeat protein [Cyanobacteria bacterium J06632_22]